MNYLNSLDKGEESAKKQALKTTGFVQVKTRTEASVAIDGGEPFLFGLFVEGRGHSGDRVARILQADGRAPEWFKQALKNEETHPTGLQFHVRVGGISERGRTAYVWPLAYDLDNAKREWMREKKILEKQPTKVNDCKTVDELALLVYKKYGEIFDLVIVKYDPQSKQALMIDKSNISYLFLAKDAEKIWNFTTGIAKGTTTLEYEIDMNVKCNMLSRS